MNLKLVVNNMKQSPAQTSLLHYSDLTEYQQSAIDVLYCGDGVLVQAKMGAGKHAIGQTVAQELIEDGVLSRVLVITTPRVRDKVWAREWRKWEHMWEPGIASGTPKQRASVITGPHKIVVVSFNVLPWLAKTFDLPELFDGLLIDETTKVKNPTGKRFTAMRKHLDGFLWRGGLTGTLGGDGNLEDVYGQVRWFSKVLGRNITTFRKDYMRLENAEYNKWAPLPGAWERAAKLIEPIIYKVDDQAYQDSLPPIVRNFIEFDLPGDVRQFIRKMQRDNIASGIVADTDGVALQKVQQATDGFVYAEEGPRRLHTARLDAFAEAMLEADGPTLVAFTYLEELAMLRERIPGPCLGAGETADLDAWDRGEIPVMYIHPRSAAHGLNLQAGGNRLVFYSMPWSRDDHDQLIARLRRQGQGGAEVWVTYIQATDSVDQVIYTAVVSKQNREAHLLELLENGPPIED